MRELEELGKIICADEEQLKRIANLVKPEKEWVGLTDEDKWEPKINRTYDANGVLLSQKIKRTPQSDWEDYCQQPEPLIRADELEAIGGESSLARTMAAHTIRLLYKENARLKKEWVGLTDEEIINIWAGVSTGYDDEINIVHLGKAIEAKLKKKNGMD